MDKELNEITKLDYNKNNLQLQIINIEKELSNNPTYIRLKEIQSQLKDYEDKIKSVAEKIIKQSGKKSVENDNVKLTWVQQYKIKKDLTLFKKILDFAEMAPSKPYVRITIKNQK